jgi:hypothetical protein
VDLLQHRDRQVEMALQNMSAALRMSMPEIIRQYLQTFELRKELQDMRSLSLVRNLPRWLPMRDMLVRRSTRRVFRRPASAQAVAPENPSFIEDHSAESEQLKTGTD